MATTSFYIADLYLPGVSFVKQYCPGKGGWISFSLYTKKSEHFFTCTGNE